MTHHPIADLVRIVAVLLPGGAAFAVSLVVLARYLKVYRVMRADDSWLGLLPRHVVLVSVAYLTLLGWGIVDTAHYFHHPLTVRTLVYAVGAICGLVALWDVLGYESHRLHR